MEASNLKNMVVLKNLPSNIVDEAIIILKNSKKIKKLEKVENNKTTNKKEKQTTQKDYILKEAEMLVNSYVSKIENKEDKKFADNKMQQKYSITVFSAWQERTAVQKAAGVQIDFPLRVWYILK